MYVGMKGKYERTYIVEILMQVFFYLGRLVCELLRQIVGRFHIVQNIDFIDNDFN
jgi:hypothetical protein